MVELDHHECEDGLQGLTDVQALRKRGNDMGNTTLSGATFLLFLCSSMYSASDVSAGDVDCEQELQPSDFRVGATGQVVSIGDNVSVLRTADLNGDGFADSVVASREHIRIYLADARGSFRLVDTILGARAVADIAVGDILGDPHPDLIATYPDAGHLRVFAGDGSGRFADHVESEYRLGYAPITLANVTGDARLDLVTGSGAFYAGLEDGRFERTGAGVDGVRDPVAVFVEDVDGDGRLDIVTAGRSDNGGVINWGSATGYERAIFFDRRLSAADMGDMDGDGRPEVIGEYADAVHTFFFDAETRVATTRSTPAIGRIDGLAAGDLDVDGALDVLLISIQPRSFVQLRGDGTGALGQAERGALIDSPRLIDLADVNGDGHLDAMVGLNTLAFTVVPGSPEGVTTALHEIPGIRTYAIVVGDFDGDGVDDIAAVTDTELLVFRGAPSEGFPQVDSHSFRGGRSIVSADFDRDGVLDLTVAAPGSDPFPTRVLLFSGRGDGTFAPRGQLEAPSNTALVAAADLDGDGFVDLLAKEDVRELLLRGRPDFSFGNSEDLNIEPDGHEYTVVDLNSDGRVDIVSDNSVSLGSGGGVFVNGPLLHTRVIGGAHAVARLDADEYLDHATLDRNANRIELNYGGADVNFTRGTPAPTSDDSAIVRAADLDGDGRDELIVGHDDENADGLYDILVYSGLEDRAFPPPVKSIRTSAVAQLETGDFDGDGRTDLLYGGIGLAINLNRTEQRPVDCDDNGIPDICDLENGGAGHRRKRHS